MFKKLMIQLLALSSMSLSAEWQSPVIVNPTQTLTTTNLPLTGLLLKAFAMSANGVEAITFGDFTTTTFYGFTKQGNGTWSNPVILASGGTFTFYSTIAIDDSGNAIAIWARNNIVESSRFDVASSSWETTPEQIPGSTGVDSVFIAMNGSGNAIAVFDIGGSLFFSLRPPLGTWSSAAAIPPATSAFANYVTVGMDADGNSVVAWVNAAATQLFVSSFVNGSWSPAITLSSNFPASPVAAVNENGQAVIVWIEVAGGLHVNAATGNIRNNTWDPSVSLPSTNAVPPPISAIDSAGNATLIWTDATLSTVSIATKSASSPTSWSIISPFATTSPGSNGCWVTMDDAGNTIAAWWDQGTTTFIRASSKAGFNGSWSPVVTLGSAVSPSQVLPSVFVGIDELGNGAAVWNFFDGTNWFVQSAYAPSLFPSLAPSNLTGSQVKNRYLKQLDLVNVLQWQASLAPNVISYRILRDGQLIATVPANSPLIYRDHNRIENRTTLYEVQAISSTGNIGASSSVILP